MSLSIHSENKWGNFCYIEDESGIFDIAKLNSEVIWTIVSPSEELEKLVYNFYPKSGIRDYNGKKFILSEKALECVPEYKSSGGSGTVINFDYEGDSWYIMVSDNKKYIQHSVGGLNKGETFKDCAIREAFEETQLNLNENSLKELGSWSFFTKTM